MSNPQIDMTGRRIGRLVVLRREGQRKTSAAWLCLCDCGTQVVRSGGGLRLGQSKSCGCLRKEKLIARNAAGAVDRDEGTYEIWRGMKRRCLEAKHVSFKHYGAKGVTVCDRWLKSFEAFVTDMGPRPAGMTIDREESSGNYEPGNCRWATDVEQARNRKNVRKILVMGVEMTIPEACAAYGINPVTAHGRIRAGWDLLTAVSHPVVPPRERTRYKKS